MIHDFRLPDPPPELRGRIFDTVPPAPSVAWRRLWIGSAAAAFLSIVGVIVFKGPSPPDDHLPGQETPSEPQIRQALSDLGSDSPKIRAEAEERLVSAGERVLSALEALRGTADPELRLRAISILKKIRWWESDLTREVIQQRLAQKSMGVFDAGDPVDTARILGIVSDAVEVPILVEQGANLQRWSSSIKFLADTTAQQVLESAVGMQELHVSVHDGAMFISRKKVPMPADLIPTLLAGLRSPELRTRLAAAVLLHRQRGASLGYSPYVRDALRAKAADAWDQWWKENGGSIRDAAKALESERLQPELRSLIAALRSRKSHWSPLYVGPGVDVCKSGGSEPNKRLTEIATVEGPEMALPEIEKLLESDDSNSRHYAIDLMGCLRRVETVDRLIALLEHPDEGTVQLAAIALSKLDSAKALLPLKKIMNGGRPLLTREFAAYAVGHLGNKIAIPFFIELLDNEVQLERQRAVICLGLFTGDRKGYDGKSPDPQAVQRWKDWWTQQGERLVWDPKVKQFFLPAPK